MTLFEWLHDAVGLTVVEDAVDHHDYNERRVTVWTGRTTFLEYVVTANGLFRQTEAWSVSKAPKDTTAAMQVILERRATRESV